MDFWPLGNNTRSIFIGGFLKDYNSYNRVIIIS
jgi:hypothetical protein